MTVEKYNDCGKLDRMLGLLREDILCRQKTYTPEVKAQQALEALSNQKTIAQLTSEYGAHQAAIGKWKRGLKENAIDIFSGKNFYEGA